MEAALGRRRGGVHLRGGGVEAALGAWSWPTVSVEAALLLSAAEWGGVGERGRGVDADGGGAGRHGGGVDAAWRLRCG